MHFIPPCAKYLCCSLYFTTKMFHTSITKRICDDFDAMYLHVHANLDFEDFKTVK